MLTYENPVSERRYQVMNYRNPIIPGFYSDPSLCRVGDDFYLVTSSFEFFPGVPLFHSRDLVNWEQLGHVLDRQSQLPLGECGTSGGVFAPTIREHNGRFYMITTSVGGSRQRPLDNFLVWTDDINGPWSEPIHIDHMGIDPSLFWDTDGRAYYTGTHTDSEGRSCIGQFEIDLSTGAKLSETKIIWYGTGGRCPEGPHMYYIDGKYYLMIAEGGTEYGHMVTLAKGDSVWGPFVSCPHNPILSHRDVVDGFGQEGGPGSFQALGHGDLTCDSSGQWWMVFHGIRPTQGQLHHIGRETMLAPVGWNGEGWPVVKGGKPITAAMPLPGRPGEGFAEQRSFDLFADFTKGGPLSPRWVYLRNPHEENYRFDGGLALTAGEKSLDDLGSPTFTGLRQQHLFMAATTRMDCTPSEKQQAGLTVFHTNEQHYDLAVTRREGRRCAVLRRRVGDMAVESAPVFLGEDGPVFLEVESDKLEYRFFAESAGARTLVGVGRTQLLSTECTRGTFTGCFVGLFCQGEGSARFEEFQYRQLPR